MASFYRLEQTRARDPVHHVFDAINFAQHEREREIRSATKIQSIVKMKQQRTNFFRIIKAVIAVQRVFRGYCARKETLRAMISRDEHRQMQIFHYFATLIQSRFRGYISRKKGYNYYSQRLYLAEVCAKSEAVRGEAKEALARQLEELAQQEAEEKRKTFEKTLTNKHHLLSTATINGVYRPPLSVAGFGTIFGTSVEDEVREKAAAEARQRKFKKDLPTRSAGADGDRNTANADAHGGSGGNGALNESPHQAATKGGGGGGFTASPPRNPKPASGGMMGTATTTRGATATAALFGGPSAASARVASSSSASAGGGGVPQSSVWGKGSLARPPPQSLQSSTPYDLVEQQERHERSLNKAILERIHGKGFAVRKAEEPKFGGTTVKCETPFVDPKGIRHSTR